MNNADMNQQAILEQEQRNDADFPVITFGMKQKRLDERQEMFDRLMKEQLSDREFFWDAILEVNYPRDEKGEIERRYRAPEVMGGWENRLEYERLQDSELCGMAAMYCEAAAKGRDGEDGMLHAAEDVGNILLDRVKTHAIKCAQEKVDEELPELI